MSRSSFYRYLARHGLNRTGRSRKVVQEIIDAPGAALYVPPRTPELKGKVERQMPYMRRLFEAHGPWVDIETADMYLTRKLVLANLAPHGSTRLRPQHVFETTERAALRPLPVTPYEREEYHCGTVRQNGHVRFRNKYYSAGEEYIGKEVTVLASKRLVQLFSLKGSSSKRTSGSPTRTARNPPNLTI